MESVEDSVLPPLRVCLLVRNESVVASHPVCEKKINSRIFPVNLHIFLLHPFGNLCLPEKGIERLPWEALEGLLKFGVTHGASDIHLEVGAPPCYRVKGDLLKARYRTLDSEATLQCARLLLGSQQLDLTQPFAE